MNKNLKDRLYFALTDGLDMEEDIARGLIDGEPEVIMDAVHRQAINYKATPDGLDSAAEFCHVLGSRLSWLAGFYEYEKKNLES